MVSYTPQFKYKKIKKLQLTLQNGAGCCMYPCDVISSVAFKGSQINDWFIPVLCCTLKPASNFQSSNFSIAYTALWIICVIYVLCLLCFRICSLLPCSHLKGKGWPLGSCLWCFFVILLRSYLVSWGRRVIWLYRFLIIAVFLTLQEKCKNMVMNFQSLLVYF